jgi:hypothetical protein
MKRHYIRCFKDGIQNVAKKTYAVPWLLLGHRHEAMGSECDLFDVHMFARPFSYLWWQSTAVQKATQFLNSAL